MFMRRGQVAVLVVLSCLVIICLNTVPASSQLFHIWGDETKTRCDWFPEEPYTVMHMYLFLTPSNDGAFAAEYKFTLPQGHFVIFDEPGPMISIYIGSHYGPPGLSLSFYMCQQQEVLLWKFRTMAPDLIPGYYTLEPHEDSDFLGVALCTEGRPMQEGYMYGQFGYHAIGYCRFAIEETSWGAIKGMYK